MNLDRYKSLALRRDGRVLHVAFNRPESLNAFDASLHDEFERLLHELPYDDASHVVVLTGNGKAFSAGGDIAAMQRLVDEPDRMSPGVVAAKRLVMNLLDVPQPIIAKVNGAAMGLGATLALFCDVVFAAHHAKIADPHVKVGFVAGDGGAVIWPILVGPARAKEFLMRGKLMSGTEAHAMGLVNHVVPAEQVMDTSMKLAQELNALPPLAVRWTKLSVNKWIKHQLNLILDASIAYEMLSINSKDHHEAAKAFLEKRAPVFKGR